MPFNDNDNNKNKNNSIKSNVKKGKRAAITTAAATTK